MKAPEKLYVDTNDRLSDSILYGFTEKRKDDDIEYTRTDAFIEKACLWLKDNTDRYLYNTGGIDEYIPKCGGKMIEDFKNYMKGE